MPEKTAILLLPSTRFMRLNDVLRFIPVSASTWWRGVKEGFYPKPISLGERITAWRAEDICELIDQLSEKAKYTWPSFYYDSPEICRSVVQQSGPTSIQP